MPDILGPLMLKLVGATVGTMLALIFKLPRSRRDFKRRAAFSLLAGVFMSPLVVLAARKVVEVPGDAETIVAFASITAFASWYVARVVLKRTVGLIGGE